MSQRVRFGNGLMFTQQPNGQWADEEGFKTPGGTHITNRHTCVSVRHQNRTVEVRNSEDLNKVTTSFTLDEWKTFTEGVRNGEFDF